jgi:uncharacterized protein YheU (UPF0270 family)
MREYPGPCSLREGASSGTAAIELDSKSADEKKIKESGSSVLVR